MPIDNLLALAKHWLRDVQKGKLGERIVAQFLTEKGFQVYPIVHYEYEHERELYDIERRIEKARETRFCPDFLVVGKDDIFFVDVKLKSSAKFLGWVNQRDYLKYFSTMKRINGIGFKIFFVVEESPGISIYALDSLVSPRNFETVAQPDGLVYVVPRERLRLCCKGYVPKLQDG
jgi:hypothetical protein